MAGMLRSLVGRPTSFPARSTPVSAPRTSSFSTGRTALVSHGQDSLLTAVGIAQDPGSMSADGRFIAFSNSQGIRLYDRSLGTPQLIASADAPDDARPRVSADGRYVAFAGGRQI